MLFGESCAVLVDARHFWVAGSRFIDIKEIHFAPPLRYRFRRFFCQTLRLAFLPLGGGGTLIALRIASSNLIGLSIFTGFAADTRASYGKTKILQIAFA